MQENIGHNRVQAAVWGRFTIMVLKLCVTILGLVGPLFLFSLHPLSLLTHLGPLPYNSHRPLLIYSTDPLVCTFVP